MRKGIIRYWLWGALATPFVWAEWLCAKVYLFIDERRFRIEREWD